MKKEFYNSTPSFLKLLRRFSFLLLAAILSSCNSSGVDLSGTDAVTTPAAYLVASPASGSFGSVYVNNTATISFTFTDVSAIASATETVSITGTGFSITANTCNAVALAAVTGSCSVTVQFSPNSTGNFAGTLTVPLTNGNSTGVPLSGTGTNLAPSMSPSPSPASFGSVTVTGTSNLSISFTNIGEASAIVGVVTISGTGFSITANTCDSQTITPNSSCAVTVTFDASTEASFIGTLDLPYTDAESTNFVSSVSLGGIGVSPPPSPTLTSSPNSMDYGNVATDVSASETFTISNASGVTAITQLATVDSSNYSITANNCNNIVLTGGSTCSITVQFAPSTTGTLTGTLSLTYLPLEGSNTLTLNVPLTGVGTVPVTDFTFAGVQSYSALNATGVTLHWNLPTGGSDYEYYTVFYTTGGVTQAVTAITPPSTTSYVLNGLTLNTTYTVQVNAYNSLNVSDGNTHTLSFTTPSVAATFNGWTTIKSVGAIAPVSQSGLSSSAAYVDLAWEPLTISSGTLASYNIYRATSSGEEDYSTPLATGISTSSAAYTDTTATGGNTYYYTVTAVVGGVSVLATTSTFSEVQVAVPPNNMSLVHRWIANRQMCNLMQQTPDPNNNYQCPYTGPGGTGTYFDVGASFFVDTFELGCNYTPAPECDPTNGCIGASGGPAGNIGNVGDVYYDRSSGNCYLKTSSGSWTGANEAGFSSSQVALLASNAPGLPPFVNVDQPTSYQMCTSLSVTNFGNKNLLTHKQQVIAADWGNTLIDSTISDIENGSNLPTTGYCNANSGSGLTYDNNDVPGDLETLPGTNSSGIRSVRTGSTSTRNCVSMYGIQDTVGNVWQWSSDQLGACDSSTHTCPGIASTLDPNNTDWANFNFDGTEGPGGEATGTVNEWNFSAESYNATQFLVPLGLPMVTGAPSSFDSMVIGTSTGQFDPAKFHGNHFWLYTDNGGSQRGAIAGGAWNGGSGVGRFTLYLYNTPSLADSNIGLRCALPAE